MEFRGHVSARCSAAARLLSALAGVRVDRSCRFTHSACAGFDPALISRNNAGDKQRDGGL